MVASPGTQLHEQQQQQQQQQHEGKSVDKVRRPQESRPQRYRE
jgi:hypothetical protein